MKKIPKMAQNNSKFTIELKMAGTSLCIAILVFIILKFLVSETKRLQTKRHKEESRKRSARIRAEKIQALKNIEMNSLTKLSPSFEHQSKSDSDLLQFCRRSQSFTYAAPPQSAYGTVKSARSASTNENVFNFDHKSISNILSTGISSPSVENGTFGRSPSCPAGTENASRNSFGFSDNYKEWSLRRRDIEISAMNFDL